MNAAIIDDHEMFADLLSWICSQELGLKVAGVAKTGKAGRELVARERPDLLLLDISLPDDDGLAMAKEFLASHPTMRIILMSSLRDPLTLGRVRSSGALGFIDKREQNIGALRETIETVSQGKRLLSPSAQRAPAADQRFNQILTPNEQRILSLIGGSSSDDEIAAELKISPATAQSKRRDIMGKLNIHSTPKLIHFAIVNGFVRTEHLDQPPPPAG
jgi:DNA-binding NarL/FixJ family response regulator